MTGKQSLFLHIAEDVERDKYSAEKIPLSSITQELIFNIDIDESIFK